MKRLNPLQVIPEEGEILDFREVFGCNFGDRNKIKQSFGNRGLLADNPKAICVHFRTGNLTEVSVGFNQGLSELADAFNLPLRLVVSTEPWGAGEVKRGTMFYVSKDGKHPSGKSTSTSWELDPSTGRLVSVEKDNDQDGLLPNTDYYVTHHWTKVREDQRSTPLPLEYQGSDDPAHGGEVPIEAGEATVVEVDGVAGFEMDLGPLGKGTFIPD